MFTNEITNYCQKKFQKNNLKKQANKYMLNIKIKIIKIYEK